jgi:hypothetical protein
MEILMQKWALHNKKFMKKNFNALLLKRAKQSFRLFFRKSFKLLIKTFTFVKLQQYVQLGIGNNFVTVLAVI